MKFYEYDINGWLIGWHEDATRPSSTTVAPDGVPPRRARWNGSAWIEDATRETQDATDGQAERTRRQQAITVLKSYNRDTATATEVRVTLDATIYLLKSIISELR